MRSLYRWGWIALTLATLAAAILPSFVSIPEPQGAIVLDHAIYQADNGDTADATMPFAAYRLNDQAPQSFRLQFRFDLPTVPDNDVFVYIPSFNRPMTLTLNERPIFDSETHTLWSGLIASTSSMKRCTL